MKKLAIYFSALGLVWLFVGADISSTMAATDATSTAELQIIDDGPVNPTTPPSEIPSGDTVENPEPIANHPNGPIDSLQNQQVTGSILGSLKQSVQKMFPKTAEATNWWLVVIGVEVLLLVSLLYFNKKKSQSGEGKLMHKKFIAGAMSALLLLNPLSAVAVSTTTSTQTSGTSSAENASNVADESETMESTTSETTASTQTTETTSDEVQSSTEAVTDSESTKSSTIEAEKTASSSEETTDSSGVEVTASTIENPRIPSYQPGTGTIIAVNDIEYFKDKVVHDYPLGIGTHFTAFAGDNLNLTGDGDNRNYDGTYAARNINFTHWNVNYYQHSEQYPSADDWNYPFFYQYGTDSTAPLALIGDTFDTYNRDNVVGLGNDADARKVLTSSNNFQDNQSFLFETDGGIIHEIENDDNSPYRTSVNGKVGDLVDFRANLGVKTVDSLYSANEYFKKSKGQLQTVSQYYNEFTSTIPAVGNSGIDPTIKTAEYVYNTSNGINEIRVEVPLLENSSTHGVAIFDLSKASLGIDNFGGNHSMRIKLDNVTSKTKKEDLPFIIFNWNDWTELNWSYGLGNMTFVGEDNQVLDGDFYKKMGSHIIHNFPSVSSGSTLELGIGPVAYPFAGTVLVPNGSIKLDSSNTNQDAFWGSLIAGENITLQLPISKKKAFGSVFDADNLPDLDDMSLKLSFTEDQVTVDNNQADNNLNILGTGNNFTVSFTKEGASETDDPLKVHWDGDTDKKDDNKLSGINLKEDTPFTIDTTGWAPGTYKIIGRVTHWTDSKGNSVEKLEEDAPFAEFTIIVPKPAEILSLDEVPDLKFDDFTLGESGVGATSNLKDFTVTNAKTFDGNSTGALTISDSRNNNTGGNWSLEVSLTPFSLVGADETVNDIDAQLTLNVQQEKTAKNSSIVTSSEAGSESAFLLHKGGNEQSATENFRVLTDVDGELSSSLQLKKPATSLGTYHSTVTWTLGDLPRSDELTTNE